MSGANPGGGRPPPESRTRFLSRDPAWDRSFRCLRERRAHVLRGCDHVDEGGTHLVPFAGFEATVRIDPDLVRRQALRRLDEEFGHLANRRHARRMDVVDARADLVRIAIGDEGVE